MLIILALIPLSVKKEVCKYAGFYQQFPHIILLFFILCSHFSHFSVLCFLKSVDMEVQSHANADRSAADPQPAGTGSKT